MSGSRHSLKLTGSPVCWLHRSVFRCPLKGTPLKFQLFSFTSAAQYRRRPTWQIALEFNSHERRSIPWDGLLDTYVTDESVCVPMRLFTAIAANTDILLYWYVYILDAVCPHQKLSKFVFFRNFLTLHGSVPSILLTSKRKHFQSRIGLHNLFDTF